MPKVLSWISCLYKLEVLTSVDTVSRLSSFCSEGRQEVFCRGLPTKRKTWCVKAMRSVCAACSWVDRLTGFLRESFCQPEFSSGRSSEVFAACHVFTWPLQHPHPHPHHHPLTHPHSQLPCDPSLPCRWLYKYCLWGRFIRCLFIFAVHLLLTRELPITTDLH